MFISKILKLGFNPYSSGFSIYFDDDLITAGQAQLLQSLFIWIFYLFNFNGNGYNNLVIASILIHLDFLSIFTSNYSIENLKASFNPYSSGFSIYLNKILETTVAMSASILIHLDFLSI